MENSTSLKGISLTNGKDDSLDCILTTAKIDCQNSLNTKSSDSDIIFDPSSYEISTNSSQPSINNYNITTNWFDKFLNKTNYKIGLFVADYPKTILAVSF